MTEKNLKNRPDNWAKIDHIVHLMLDNRSFDNLLGWLYDGNAWASDFNGLDDRLFNTLSNVDSDGNPCVEQVFVRRNGQPPKYGGYVARNPTPCPQVDFTQPDPDPGEGYMDTTQQLFGALNVDSTSPPDPTMQGFVDNYQNAMLYGTYSFGDAPADPRRVMNCYTSDQTPVLSTLAK